MAQSIDESIDVMVLGESGLIECSPPWDRPVWLSDRLVWPSGAFASVYSPERPQALRGHQHDLFWASEVAAWSPSRRDEAWSNLRLTLRLGLGRLVWDGTPRRRNPLVRELLARCERNPEQHLLRRGTTSDNRLNLAPECVAEWLAEYGGTQKGLEELMGQFLDDDLEGLVRQAWIDAARRDLPTHLARRIVSIDPAITSRNSSDATGIVEIGLGVDEQIHVLADHTDRLSWESWTALGVDLYVRGKCDCLVVERNRGGDACVAGLRSAAKERGFNVVVLGPMAPTRWQSGTVYVKEVLAKGSKESRLDPIAGLYEKGRVSHVRGADLTELEEQLTTWIPGEGASPNALDAAVHGLWEISQLGDTRASPAAQVKQIEAVQRLQRELTNNKPRPGSPARVGTAQGVIYGGPRRTI
jgi:phage terminase large subunit-like protein